ncbi:MAG: glutaredoxin 3 [Pseudohongiellaceae bacterium]|jgi:glutaredoxin 3
MPITIYTKRLCAYCTAAKQLLKTQGYQYEEIALDTDFELAREVMDRSGQRTVPQIFVGDHSVGGYQELHQQVSSGEFASLLKQE